MCSGNSYGTIGMVYDYLEENHRKFGGSYTFPAALEGLRAEGKLLGRRPEFPPFYSGMDVGAFQAFVRGLCVYADAILPQASTFLFSPTIEEATLFPQGKDVFCVLNMPHMTEISHSHDFFEITYIVEGSCTFSFEGESAALFAGDLCIVSPGSAHCLPVEPGCMALSVVVRRSTFDSIFGNLLTQKDLLSLFFRSSLYGSRRANYLLLKTGQDLMTRHTLQELTYECNLVDDYANDSAVSLLNLFLARALRAASAAVTLHHYEGFGQREFDFTLILQYIQQNYRTVTLSALAGAFHFSEAYLSKLIRKKLNRSFTEILRGLKMNHARDYLLHTTMKISEIAETVGYDSVDHFTRTFRRVYGMPPTEYRKGRGAQRHLESEQ